LWYIKIIAVYSAIIYNSFRKGGRRMKEFSIHHYLWFAALAVSVILAIGGISYWYVPVVIYFIAEIVGLFILSILKGKVKKLPKLIKKAAIRAAEK